MKIISVHVGLPRAVSWDGETRLTSIAKLPISGPVRVRRLNLDGDEQSDLTVHGGPDKAVYGYPSEHYPYWERWADVDALPPASFGENLTTEGMTEDEVWIGDQYRMGSALLQVTQPRMPCYKLGIHRGTQDIVAAFLDSGLSGFYFSVLEEGELATGDPIALVDRVVNSVTVRDIVRAHLKPKQHRDLLERAVRVDALADTWHTRFRARLERG